MARRTVTILTAALVVGGCGTSVTYTPLKAPPYPLAARPTASVVVRWFKPPKRPHHTIGMLKAIQETANSLDDGDAIVAEMRAEAGRRGCDVLVVQGSADELAFATYGMDHSTGSAFRKGFRGACVVYEK